MGRLPAGPAEVIQEGVPKDVTLPFASTFILMFPRHRRSEVPYSKISRTLVEPLVKLALKEPLAPFAMVDV